MVSPLLIDEPPLLVLPSLAVAIGLNEAIVLQQMHYWLNHRSNRNFFEGRHWVHNTFTQWQQQFTFWSKKTIKRTISRLEETGLLISFVTRNLSKTKYYTLNYDLLNRIRCPKWTEAEKGEAYPESAENQVFHPWGQNDPLEGDKVTLSIGSKWPSRKGQSDTIEGDKVAPSIVPEEEDCPESSENQGFRPRGQNDPLEGDKVTLSIGSKWPSRKGQSDTIEEEKVAPSIVPEEEDCPESTGNQGVNPWGQHDPLGDKVTPSIGSKWPSRRGHNDPVNGDKVTPFHYTKITSENTILPPLSPPSSARDGFEEQPKEEEEEENKNLKIKNTIPPMDRMIEIWNQTVQSKIHSGQVLHLTEHREKLLRQFWETVLRDRQRILSCAQREAGKGAVSELDAWQQYCDLIAKSRFLGGENPSGFKVTLEWALTPDKAYKVLEGAIYDKPRLVPKAEEPFQGQSMEQPWEAFVEDLAQTLPPSPYRQQWVQIAQTLAKKIGQVRYKTWFSKVYLGEMPDADTSASTVILHVGGRFLKDYIDTNFRFDILDAIQTVYPCVKYLDFRIVPIPGGPK